jgi:hypothetical protein
MNNTAIRSSILKKMLKITVSAVISLLFTVLVAFTATATTTEERINTPSIEAFNLSFSETICVYYAVDFPVGVSSSGLLIWQGDAPEKYGHGYGGKELSIPGGQAIIDGKELKTYAYRDLALKELTDDLYAVPYAEIGGEYVYGEPTKYSVVQYAYNMRDNEKLRPLLDSMLEVGARAQIYFDYRLDRLANEEFVKIRVHGGLLPDGTDFGMFIAGKDSLPIPTPPSGENGEFDGWYEDAEFTKSLDKVSSNTRDAYAKWKSGITELVNTDFSEKIGPNSVSYYNGGVSFLVEGSAVLETFKDGDEKSYLKISNGKETSLQVTKSNVGTSMADLYENDVFSFSFVLGAQSGKNILTTTEFGIQSDKDKSGNTSHKVVNLTTISSDGTVSTSGGYELGELTSDEPFTINVAVNFAEGTFTYYSEGSEIIRTEKFSVPQRLGVKTTKEWQSLIQKFLFHAYFDKGNTILIYDIVICVGNMFE